MPMWEYRIPNGTVPPELRNVPEPGECIYCGSRGRRTTEHVVPGGMGGAVTIPRGSCNDCQERIHIFETHCMRSTLLQPRLASGLHRHPHEAPNLFPVTFTDWTDRKRTAHVSSEEFPVLWIMPVLETPGILSGSAPEESSLGMLTIQQSDDKDARFQRLLALPGVKSVSIGTEPVRVDWFARWLAKIAFGFAVACIGLDAIRHSEVRSLIREGSGRYGYLVGGLNQLRLPSHEYCLRRADQDLLCVVLSDIVFGGRVWWVVKMRLLGRLQTPDYMVVLGPR